MMTEAINSNNNNNNNKNRQCEESFELNTNLRCFYCLQPVVVGLKTSQVNNIKPEPESQSGGGQNNNKNEDTRHSVCGSTTSIQRNDENCTSQEQQLPFEQPQTLSIQNVCEFLQINVPKIVTDVIKTPAIVNRMRLSSSNSSLLQTNNLTASLCDSCTDISKKLADLFETLEKIHMDINVLLSGIFQAILKGKQDGSLLQSYHESMAKNLASMLLSAFIDTLREEISEKCLPAQIITQASSQHNNNDHPATTNNNELFRNEAVRLPGETQGLMDSDNDDDDDDDQTLLPISVPPCLHHQPISSNEEELVVAISNKDVVQQQQPPPKLTSNITKEEISMEISNYEDTHTFQESSVISTTPSQTVVVLLPHHQRPQQQSLAPFQNSPFIASRITRRQSENANNLKCSNNNDTQIKCDVCGKKGFRSLSSLNMHKRIKNHEILQVATPASSVVTTASSSSSPPTLSPQVSLLEDYHHHHHHHHEGGGGTPITATPVVVMTKKYSSTSSSSKSIMPRRRLSFGNANCINKRVKFITTTTTTTEKVAGSTCKEGQQSSSTTAAQVSNSSFNNNNSLLLIKTQDDTKKKSPNKSKCEICKLCNKYFSNPEELEIHHRNNNKRCGKKMMVYYKCKRCQGKFVDRKWYKEHRKMSC